MTAYRKRVEHMKSKKQIMRAGVPGRTLKRSPTAAMDSAEYLKPINVDRETWMYAESRGLCVVRQLRDPRGVLVQGDMFYLPWHRVRFALSKAPK